MPPKIPTPAKENSREWAWVLQQNIMGLSFEHTQLILKHTQHGHLGIVGENHMIFPQLIFILNFLASSFSTSTRSEEHTSELQSQ